MNDIKRGYTDTGYLVVFVREVRLTSRQANQLLGRHTGPASTQLPRATRYCESGTTQPAVADQRTCGQNPRNDGRRAGRDFSVLEFRRISWRHYSFHILGVVTTHDTLPIVFFKCVFSLILCDVLISSFGVGSYPRAQCVVLGRLRDIHHMPGTSFDHRHATICNSAKMPSLHFLRRVHRVSTLHRTRRYMVLGGFASDHVILRLEGRTPDGLTDYDAAFQVPSALQYTYSRCFESSYKPVDFSMMWPWSTQCSNASLRSLPGEPKISSNSSGCSAAKVCNSSLDVIPYSSAR